MSWTIAYPGGADMVPEFPVSRLYFLFNNNSTSGTGNLYIDNVRLVYNCAAPPTYPSWHFESTGSERAVGVDFTPGGAVSTWSNVGYNSSTGSYNANIPFSATGQEANIQMTTNCFGVGHLPGDLAGRSVRARVWMDAAIAGDGAPQAGIFLQTGAGWTWESGGYVNLTPDDWTLVEFTPTTSDMAAIVRIGVQVLTQTDGTTRGAGNIRVDDLEIY
jgi:hypothetical protein